MGGLHASQPAHLPVPGVGREHFDFQNVNELTCLTLSRPLRVWERKVFGIPLIVNLHRRQNA